MPFTQPPVFGVNIDPSTANLEAALQRARLADESDVELVTIQDHPYNADFLDTWTLLTALAARTERVHIATNVMNTPLRPPAMMAKMAATLDLITKGRLELGLGAGGYIEGMQTWEARSDKRPVSAIRLSKSTPKSCAACGITPAGASRILAGFTRWANSFPAQLPHIPFRYGLGPVARVCCASRDAWLTAGWLARFMCRPSNCPKSTPCWTKAPRRPVAIRPKCGAATICLAQSNCARARVINSIVQAWCWERLPSGSKPSSATISNTGTTPSSSGLWREMKRRRSRSF
ncbi:MAG: LLM class flavin-dependent oxidoreductase [Chloroflexi bacterium]|nr:LLM class flavin-dependent oxidoreductase [Chloroflexota bacterium]